MSIKKLIGRLASRIARKWGPEDPKPPPTIEDDEPELIMASPEAPVVQPEPPTRTPGPPDDIPEGYRWCVGARAYGIRVTESHLAPEVLASELKWNNRICGDCLSIAAQYRNQHVNPFAPRRRKSKRQTPQPQLPPPTQQALLHMTASPETETVKCNGMATYYKGERVVITLPHTLPKFRDDGTPSMSNKVRVCKACVVLYEWKYRKPMRQNKADGIFRKCRGAVVAGVVVQQPHYVGVQPKSHGAEGWVDDVCRTCAEFMTKPTDN